MQILKEIWRRGMAAAKAQGYGSFGLWTEVPTLRGGPAFRRPRGEGREARGAADRTGHRPDDEDGS